MIANAGHILLPYLKSPPLPSPPAIFSLVNWISGYRKIEYRNFVGSQIENGSFQIEIFLLEDSLKIVIGKKYEPFCTFTMYHYHFLVACTITCPCLYFTYETKLRLIESKFQFFHVLIMFVLLKFKDRDLRLILGNFIIRVFRTIIIWLTPIKSGNFDSDNFLN